MNKVISLITLFACFFFFHSFAQRGESVIYFEDGTQKKWHIRNIHNFKHNNKVTKPLTRIELNDKNSNELIVYENILLKKRKKGKKIFVRVIYEGPKASLYSRYILHNRDVVLYGSPGPIGDVHYAKKKNDTYAVEISLEGSNAIYGNKFKKNASIFFSDCSELVSKIKNREIKNSDKIRAFEFYENNCN